MRDFLPADVRKREYVISIIKDVYESYGFEPLETPAVENIETLMGKYGEEGNQLIFKILKRGEKLDDALAQNPQSEIRNPQLSHPSLEKFDVAEAIADEIFAGLQKEKACTFEPNGKPCDHCAMCSSRGF